MLELVELTLDIHSVDELSVELVLLTLIVELDELELLDELLLDEADDMLNELKVVAVLSL